MLASGYLLATIPAAALVLPGDSFAKFGAVFALSGVYMGFWETVEVRQQRNWADMFGWPELAKKVAGVYASLSPEDRRRAYILTRCSQLMGEGEGRRELQQPAFVASS